MNSAEVTAVEFSTLLDKAIPLARASSGPAAERLVALRERLLAGRFQVAVLGQFKRGKSTLLNALLGAPVLPTGVVPLTSVPTFISWDASPSVLVTYRKARPPEKFATAIPDRIREVLHEFVAEEANPKNIHDVDRVDLFYPAPLLQSGVVLIDTPGIGSTHKHNTDAALRILPECDAAIFVTSADPPITESELDYLRAVQARARRLYFILNKVDYLNEQDLQTATAFLRDVLRPIVSAGDLTIFPASSLLGLRAKEAGDRASLVRSGVAQIEESVFAGLQREKLALLGSAIAQKTAEQLAEAAADLELNIRALEIPIADLDRRASSLDHALAQISNERTTIHDLLAGDQRRMMEDLEKYSSLLRESFRRDLLRLLANSSAEADEHDVPLSLQRAFLAALPAMFERELDAMLERFGRAIEEILAARARHVDELIAGIRRAAAEVFDVCLVTASNLEKFSLHHDPYWVAHPQDQLLISLPPGVVDRLLPKVFRERRRQRLLERQVRDLALRNVENLRWAALQGIRDTFGKFGSAMDKRLADALMATQGAVKAALALRASQADAVAIRLAELRQSLQDLDEVRSLIRQAAADVRPAAEASSFGAGEKTLPVVSPSEDA